MVNIKDMEQAIEKGEVDDSFKSKVDWFNKNKQSVNHLYKYECLDCGAVHSTKDYEHLRCSCGAINFKLLAHEEGTTPPEFIKKSYVKKNDADLRYDILMAIKDKKWSEVSEMMATYIEESLHIYTTKCDNKSEMWVYKDGIYTPNGRSEIKELLRRVLGDIFSNFHYNAALAKIEADTFIEPDDFFKIRYMEEIPVLNGILNIYTKKLSPFTPNKIFFSKLPVRYDPEAKCPQIDKFLEDILPYNEDKKIYYELGGFALLKEYKFEKAFMFVGDGRNGKGKAIDLMKRVIGSDNCAAIPLASLEAESFSISGLFNKMLNLGGDISNTDLKDTSMFKSLTGRDLVRGKRKFLNDISFVNFAKFVFACNELPMVYDTKKGFWDRWILLDFPYTFVTLEEYESYPDKSMVKIRDEDILDKITTPEEMSGLLNKFLEALDKLLATRTFSTTKGSDEVKNLWIRKANSFISFCIDNIEEEYDSRITKRELRKKYSDYCKVHKVPGKSDKVIRNTLQEYYGASEERIFESLRQTHDWYWIGIKWRKNDKK